MPANHAEAVLRARRRKWATLRRKPTLYANTTTGWPRLFHGYWVVHQVIRVPFPTREVPAVTLGVIERRLSGREIFQIHMA
jgi:hypothetical protein